MPPSEMTAAARDWVIGVDFDNTIASYDALMHALALERGLIAADTLPSKKLIRDSIRALHEGETHWRGLQVTAYGPRMHDARLLDGVKEFFAECRRSGVPVYIVSHKTEYANFGEANVNLRVIAMGWLEQQGFFENPGPGLRKADVFFESTRVEKCQRIQALGVTHFIDDLEETFLERAFPGGVQRILLARDGGATEVPGALRFSAWREIRQHLFDRATAAS